MRYRHLVIGFVLGVLFSYGAYRIVHHIKRSGGFSVAGISVGPTAQADNSPNKSQNELPLSQFSLAARAKLGQVTFTYDIVPLNRSDDAVMQMYLNVGGEWQEFTPANSSGNIVFRLSNNLHCAGTFNINLPKGKYTAYRILLFSAPDGKNADYSHTIWDSSKEKKISLPTLNIDVLSSAAPIISPIITYPPNPSEQKNPDGRYDITIPAIVKYPKDYVVDGGGFWVMAKGSGGFSQVWADAKNAISNGTADASFYQIPVNFVLKDVKSGVWNVQFGLFKPSFGDPIIWIYPGLDFEAGGSAWVSSSPTGRIPPRLKVVDNRFTLLSGAPYNFYAGSPLSTKAAAFVRGGNYGNAITWTMQPALNTPGYFALLSGAGCHYIRFNYDPDKYLRQRVYQDSVDQVVQNIWSAGLYPIIAPQDLPKGDTLEERINQGRRLMGMVATKYAGKSVWIEECNEPHEFSTWAQWKPVAESYCKTIRSVDQNAFVIVPFEGFSKDGSGAAASPITDVHVDMYDGHAYLDPSKVNSAFAGAIKAGLPVLIGEYGSNDPGYLHAMDRVFQQLSPSPMAASPWAFTINGQDSLPLVADGSTAHLVLTPAGQAIANDYSKWNNGQKVE
jgi:hypothetical protein